MFLKIFFISVVVTSVLFPQTSGLKILTINAWSGLDYNGRLSMGEYEKSERKEERILKLVKMIIAQKPDVVFIQEANPVSTFSSRLTCLTGYDEIHLVCNAGIKIGPVGIPSNLKEGIIILSRPGLKLKKADVWKLSGSFGIYGDPVSIHFDQSAFALIGKIIVKNIPVYLADIHTSYCPANDSSMLVIYKSLAEKKGYSADERKRMLDDIDKAVERRDRELEILKKKIKALSADNPLVVAGDFNLSSDDEIMKRFIAECRLSDTFIPSNSGSPYTWDPANNVNTLFSTGTKDARGEDLDGYGLCCAKYDSLPRRIDYILLSDKFQKQDVADYNILNNKEDADCSDHMAVTAVVDLENLTNSASKEYEEFMPFSDNSLEPLPIVSYDNDAGFGYGAKAFFLNQAKLNESFDITIFNSTNGERWYRMVVSLPDLERRQGKIYPFACDLAIDYDKWIKNSFYGIGSGSSEAGKEYYTKEPLEISLTSSRGFSTEMVGQAGIKYKSIRSSGFENSGKLIGMNGEINNSDLRYYSMFLNLRYDSRNSFINPGEGLVLQLEGELSLKQSFPGKNFSRIAGALQYYTTLFYPQTILATRLMLQSLQGDALPLQMLLPLGGNSTLRGYPQDRFLDKSISLINSELRFPLYWRFGGIMGVDCGKVAPGIDKMNLKDWVFSPAAGLRFYMDNFIIRLDMGFSSENTGIYFNFNHIF